MYKLTPATALLAATLVVAGCAPGSGHRYDPDAKETLGRVTEKRNTGATTRQVGVTSMLHVKGLFIPITLDGSPALPVFEYGVALEDGRRVQIYSWYALHEVGGCVKLFESEQRSDYPRLTNFYGCKS